jgi:hypothetical protein
MAQKPTYDRITIPNPTLIMYHNHADGCAFQRCMIPAQNMRKVATEVSFQEADYRWKHTPVIIQRIADKKWNEIVHLIKAAGQPVLQELDDSFTTITEHSNPLQQLWKPEMFKEHFRSFKLVDGAIFSVEAIAEQYKHLIKENVHIVPNMIDFDLMPTLDEVAQIKREKNPENKIVIGWYGSFSHHYDIQSHYQFFKDLSEIPNVELHFGFYDPKAYNKRWENVPYKVWKWETDYKRFYRNVAPFDIGLIIASDNKFNQAKSDIKFLEYGAMGIPCVSDKTLPYMTIKHKETGFLAKNQTRMFKHIVQLVNEEAMRREIGQNAYKYVYNERNANSLHRYYERIFGYPYGFLEKNKSELIISA